MSRMTVPSDSNRQRTDNMFDLPNAPLAMPKQNLASGIPPIRALVRNLGTMVMRWREL